MNPALLYQLAWIIELGSLSRAAKQLGVTQPTLTRNVRILEDRVGSPVLRRGRYGVTPTEIGVRLAEQGRIIGETMALADTTVEQWKSGLSGELRIGVGPFLAMSMMPVFFVRAAEQKWPYAMRIITATAARLIERLNEDELDIAVVPSQINLHQEKLSQEEVLDDELSLFVGRRSPYFNRRDTISLEELRDCVWIDVGTMSRISGSLDDVLRGIGISDYIPMFSFSGDMVMPLELLKSTNTITVAARRLIRFKYPDTELRELQVDATFPRRNIAIWVANSNRERPEIVHFSKQLKAYFKEVERDPRLAEVVVGAPDAASRR